VLRRLNRKWVLYAHSLSRKKGDRVLKKEALVAEISLKELMKRGYAGK